MSNVDRSKCSGGCPEIRSVGAVPKYGTAHSTKRRTLACVITTPLGMPVEPDVNRMWAGSCGPFALAGSVAGYVGRSASENRDGTPAGVSSAPSQPIEWGAAKPRAAKHPSHMGPTTPPPRIQPLLPEGITLLSPWH